MDDDLRALEQEFRASPTPGGRLALARALERAGRRHGAHALLAGDPFAPGVLDELTRYPCWSQRDGGPGRARWLDVAPLEAAPRLRWRVDLGGWASDLLATPWGVVVQGGQNAEHRLYVLDPDSGERRCDPSGPSVLLGVERGVLLHSPSDEGPRDEVTWWLTATDLATGKDLWRSSAPEPAACLAGGRLVAGLRHDGALLVFELADLRRAPPWRYWSPLGHTHAMTGRHVYALRGAGDVHVAALDRAVRPERRRHRSVSGLAADGEGVLLRVGGSLRLFDPSVNAERWRRRTRRTSAWLGPAHVLTWSGSTGPAALARSTGEPLASRGPLEGVAWVGAGPFAGAGGWTFGFDARRQVVGHQVEGQGAWVVNVPDVTSSGEPLELAPAWGRRLYGATRDGVVFCLEEAA